MTEAPDETPDPNETTPEDSAAADVPSLSSASGSVSTDTDVGPADRSDTQEVTQADTFGEDAERERSDEVASAETPSDAATAESASASGEPSADVEPNDGEVIPPPPDATPVDDVDLAALEALLFATHHPLTAGRLAELLELPSTKPVRRAIQALNAAYEATGRSFRVEQVAGGYQLLTLPQFGERLKRLVQKEQDARLTKAAMETLAIIAYKQPILRVDVEAIRGVACGEAIRGLMEKHLVKIAGRAEEPGRPILYGTTKRFLEVFGLNAINDLPTPEQAAKRKQDE